MLESGFVFVEIYTQRLAEYTNFFTDVCGFDLVRSEKDFVEVRSLRAIIFLNASKQLSTGHPFRDKLPWHGMGLGVEIGIVISDISIAREAATHFADWTVTEIRNQDWGMSDFRVTTPEGYYIRLTEEVK